MPKINAQSLNALLKDPPKFSVEMGKVAAEISSMSPDELLPIVQELQQILSLNSRTVMPAIMAVRLIKQTLFQAEHCFYMMTVLKLLPLMFQLINDKPITTPEQASQRLSNIWQVRQSQVLQVDANSFRSLCVLLTEFFVWFATNIPKHPQCLQGMASFSSHMHLYKELTSNTALQRLTEFTFFRDQDRQLYAQNLSRRTDSEKWSQYCENLVDTLIETKSNKYVSTVRQLVGTGDHLAIKAVINGMKQWIASQSQPSLEQLKLCSQIASIGEIQFNELIQTDLLPFFLKRLLNDRQSDPIQEQMLQIVGRMRFTAERKSLNFQVYQKLLKKKKYGRLGSIQIAPASLVLPKINLEKQKQLKVLYLDKKQKILYEIDNFVSEEPIPDKSIKSSKSLKILQQLEGSFDKKYNEEGIYQEDKVQNKFSKGGIGSGSGHPFLDSISVKKSTQKMSFNHPLKNSQKASSLSKGKILASKKFKKEIDHPINEFYEDNLYKKDKSIIPSVPEAQSQIRSSSCSSSRIQKNKSSSRLSQKKHSEIMLRRSKNKLHSKEPMVSPKKTFTATDQYFPEAIGSRKAKASADTERQDFMIADRAWRRMQAKPKKKKDNKPIPQLVIPIQQTVSKPKFGFKAEETTQNQTKDYFDEGISQESSEDYNLKISNKKVESANFMDILRIQENEHVRVVKSGDIEGYFMSKVDNKEVHIERKIKDIKRQNDQYDQLIRQKERDIEAMKRKLQHQTDQAENYKVNFAKAYENAYENPDSLMMSSLNYDAADEKMSRKIANNNRIDYNFRGIPKKLLKQIIYGKCLLFENQYIQIGFDNKSKASPIELYFTVKQSLLEFQCDIEGMQEAGYMLADGFSMKTYNVPAGKKIKSKIYLDYLGSLSDDLSFMSLVVMMKVTATFKINETITLPYCLYRNYFKAIAQKQPKKTLKIRKGAQQNSPQNQEEYNYSTGWQNGNEDLCKRPKQFLQTLLGLGVWVEEGIYAVTLLYKDYQQIKIRVLINRRNFALATQDDKHLDVINVIGSLLSRPSTSPSELD